MINLNKKIAALMSSAPVLAALSVINSFAADDVTTVGAINGTDGAAATPDPVANPGGFAGFLGSIPPWVLILVYVVIIGALFFFLIIWPQRKRKKEEEEMKNSICLGQDVVTIGGICGKIVNIKDDNITIQTSIDNSLVEVKNWAIREVKKVETDKS
ncbi:MAG: preprotein translocase subunit YajC [Clostridia bacterium]|nr:preprotein translocase subunit YajC [Clostridia bacterium]